MAEAGISYEILIDSARVEKLLTKAGESFQRYRKQSEHQP